MGRSERSNVCLRCSEIKQACDGGIPCSRCLRLSLPCCPRTAPLQNAMHTAAPESNWATEKPKARIRRVQTGCVTCKKRKKKCDEGKPRCGNCGRLCLECVWPAKDRSAARRRSISISPRTGPVTAVATIYPIESRNSTETSFSFESNEDQGLAAMSSLVPDMDFNVPMDDLSWDFSLSPGWLDLTAQTPPLATSPPDSLASSSLSMYIPSLVPDLTSPDDKALLNHYSSIVASVLCRRTDTTANPYLTYLLPMALSNELVMNCVLALSAKHWHMLQPRMRNRGLLLQSRATQSLAGLLPHVDSASTDKALVSSLLLCMTELFDGTSPRWKLHLTGAKRLLTAMKLQLGDDLTGHYKFLIRLSRFLDSATTTTTCMPPLIEEEKGETILLDRLAAAPDDEDTAVYGIPKSLFHLVDRINDLANKRKTRVDEQSEAAFALDVMAVEDRLDHWSFEHGGLSRAVSKLSPTNDDVLYATTAFESALRLRLHQIAEGYALDHPKVSQSVESILDSVQKIRYGSPLEGCLLFPLVMAGGSCDRLEHRVIIQDRLMVMERTYGFGYIYHSRELIEKVWSRRDQLEGTGAIVNWARIRYEEMGGLAVF